MSFNGTNIKFSKPPRITIAQPQSNSFVCSFKKIHHRNTLFIEEQDKTVTFNSEHYIDTRSNFLKSEFR